MSAASGKVLGVDIGGTFTDFALLDTRTGAARDRQVPHDAGRSEPRLSRRAATTLCRKTGTACAELERISHATTLVTNAIIERKGCRTGLIVTAGFADILLMGRESRYDHYDFKFERPEPLVPRSLTREVKRADRLGRRRASRRRPATACARRFARSPTAA